MVFLAVLRDRGVSGVEVRVLMIRISASLPVLEMGRRGIILSNLLIFIQNYCYFILDSDAGYHCES